MLLTDILPTGYLGAQRAEYARRRPAHDYLRTAWILIVVAAFAGGLPVAPWLLPALVMTWAAAQRAQARSAAQ